ncbi:hypothetical protein Tco_0143624 [Tanacetum coccineum]
MKGGEGGDDIMMMMMIRAAVAVVSGGAWTARDMGDRVDPVVRITFGLGRKTPPEKFSGGDGGGRRWWGFAGKERENKEGPKVKVLGNFYNILVRDSFERLNE